MREAAGLVVVAGARKRDRLKRSPWPDVRREAARPELGGGGLHLGETAFGVSERQPQSAAVVAEDEERKQRLTAVAEPARFEGQSGLPGPATVEQNVEQECQRVDARRPARARIDSDRLAGVSLGVREPPGPVREKRPKTESQHRADDRSLR